MYKIVESQADHLEKIASLLAKHFESLNRQVGSHIYQTDAHVMMKYLKKRHQNKRSNFKYYSLINENNDFLGFVNLYIKNTEGEVIAMLLTNEDDAESKNTYLLRCCEQVLGSYGIQQTHAEISSTDSMVSEAIINKKSNGHRKEAIK
jgi:predicted transcriptional regulator YheO